MALSEKGGRETYCGPIPKGSRDRDEFSILKEDTVNSATKRLIEKIAEINKAISQLWREAGGLKGSVLNFFNPKFLLKAKEGVLFIGFTSDVFNYDRTLKRFIKMPDPRARNRQTL